MPYETINHTTAPDSKVLVIGWNKIGWVQASIYPPGYQSTGDAFIVDLKPSNVDRLLKVLKRAKRQAYSHGLRHATFEERT